MANNYWNEQISTEPELKKTSYKGMLQGNKTPPETYIGKAMDGGADIGMSGKNKGRDIGMTPDSQGLERGTTKGKREYS